MLQETELWGNPQNDGRSIIANIHSLVEWVNINTKMHGEHKVKYYSEMKTLSKVCL
jgi:hypothetical protein